MGDVATVVIPKEFLDDVIQLTLQKAMQAARKQGFDYFLDDHGRRQTIGPDVHTSVIGGSAWPFTVGIEGRFLMTFPVDPTFLIRQYRLHREEPDVRT